MTRNLTEQTSQHGMAIYRHHLFGQMCAFSLEPGTIASGNYGIIHNYSLTLKVDFCILCFDICAFLYSGKTVQR